jgi:sugar lactone lactonase YvrE
LDIFDSLGNRVDPGIDGHVLGFPGASPGGIAFDGHGNLYVADSPGAKILLIDPDHHVEVVVRGFNPTGIALGPDGDIYAASSVDFPLRPGEVWRISPDGEPEVVAQFESEGAQAIAVDTGGNVFVSLINLNGSRVVRLSPDGAIENFATGPYDFGTIAADGSGGLYVSIPNSGEIYRAEGDGSLSPFARGLSRGEVHCFTLAVSPEGVLYAADSNTGDILRFSRDGDYVVVAHLSDLTGFPNALSVGPAGTLFVQTGGVPLYLYRVLPTGAYEVVASDVWGDPAGLAFDGQRNLYISRGGTVDRLQGLIVP